MAHGVERDDLVVLGGTRLGSVIDPDARLAGARGIRVVDGGMYSSFVQDWCVKRAEVGVTVCEHPIGHGCGLLHLGGHDLARVRERDAARAAK